MRAFEFLTEYGSRKGVRRHKYRDGKKPPWFDKAVQLKTDNPRMTAKEIGKLVGHAGPTVLNWLAGTPISSGNIFNDNPPFTEKDFHYAEGNRKYFDGEKPWWYEEAIAMRKQGMTWQAISNKLSTPEERITLSQIHIWLVKGSKHRSGNLVNPDAPFKPRPKAKPINTDLIKELILDPDLSDADIIELIADEKGDKIASQVRAMLPKLRQQLNPGTSVIDKTRTGSMRDPDITGFIKEKYTGDNWQLLEVDDYGDCYEANGMIFRDIKSPTARLVHADITPRLGKMAGRTYGHAWIEDGDKLVDYTTGSSIMDLIKGFDDVPEEFAGKVSSKSIFYGIADPKNIKKYDTKAFSDMIRKHKHWGPWELPQGSL